MRKARIYRKSRGHDKIPQNNKNNKNRKNSNDNEYLKYLKYGAAILTIAASIKIMMVVNDETKPPEPYKGYDTTPSPALSHQQMSEPVPAIKATRQKLLNLQDDGDTRLAYDTSLGYANVVLQMISHESLIIDALNKNLLATTPKRIYLNMLLNGNTDLHRNKRRLVFDSDEPNKLNKHDSFDAFCKFIADFGPDVQDLFAFKIEGTEKCSECEQKYPQYNRTEILNLEQQLNTHNIYTFKSSESSNFINSNSSMNYNYYKETNFKNVLRDKLCRKHHHSSDDYIFPDDKIISFPELILVENDNYYRDTTKVYEFGLGSRKLSKLNDKFIINVNNEKIEYNLVSYASDGMFEPKQTYFFKKMETLIDTIEGSRPIPPKYTNFCGAYIIGEYNNVAIINGKVNPTPTATTVVHDENKYLFGLYKRHHL